MRASVTSLSKKFISTFFAATLALGLIPVAAFADNGEEADDVIPNEELQDESVGDALASSNGEDLIEDNASTGDDSNLSIPAATQRINQDMTLQTRTVAQAESTRSYFLAQTLESTRTVPIVSANLPLDTSSIDVIEPAAEGEGSPSQEEEGDDGEDDPDADDPVDASFTLASYEDDSAVSAESTVVGSFTYRGITYAVEPGGESVAVVAADYSKLPEEFIEAQAIVIPSVVTFDGLSYYSVTRVADCSFANIKTEDDGITAVGIPASVTNIEPDAFTDFTTLQYIVVDEDNPNYSSYDGALYDVDQTSLLLIPEGRLGAVRIAPSVTEIDPEVFSHCPSVDTLVTDADSAAYQLLSESDFHNANGEPLLVAEEASSDMLFEPGFYLDLMGRESDMVPDASYEAAAIDSDERNTLDALDGNELGIEKWNCAIYAAGIDQKVCAWYGIGQGQDGHIAIPYGEQGKRKALLNPTDISGNPIETWAATFLDGDKQEVYAYFSSVQHVLSLHNHPQFMDVPTSNANFFGFYALLDSPAADTPFASYDGGVMQCNLKEHGFIEEKNTWRRIGETEAILLASDYYATYFVDTHKGEYVEWPWAYGGEVARAPIPKTEGHAFIGWFSERQASFNPYVEGEYICGGLGNSDRNVIPNVPTLSSNVDLYAHYAPVYEIAFDDEKGSEGAEAYKAYGEYLPLKTKVDTPNRDGWTFEGYYELLEDGTRNFWYDGNGDLITPTNGNSYGSYPLTSDVTLYAQWSRDIGLDPNVSSTPNIIKTINVTWGLPVPEISGIDMSPYNYDPENLTFDGFWSARKGGNCYYDKDLQATPAGFQDDVDVLYAHWLNKQDMHNHVYCSSGLPENQEKGGHDGDGYAWGWTCPSYDSYIARVYVEDAPQAEYEALYQDELSDAARSILHDYKEGVALGAISIDAVKAGEYYLIAGGRNAAGVLSTTIKNPNGDADKIDAWWEITSTTSEGPGTLRIHSDRGAIVNSGLKWSPSEMITKIKTIIFDHLDALNMKNWFNYVGEVQLEEVEFIGNTFPPSCTDASMLFYGPTRLHTLSDNFTLNGSALTLARGFFHSTRSLASIPKGFGVKTTSSLVPDAIRENAGIFMDAYSLESLPDRFAENWDINEESYGFFFMVGEWYAQFEIWKHLPDARITLERMGKLESGTKKLRTYYAGTDAATKGLIEIDSIANSFRTLDSSQSLTWDARGGTFNGDYYFDCSRVYSIGNGAAAVSMPTALVNGKAGNGSAVSKGAVIEPYRSADDKFIGWYKKVPMASAAPDDVPDKKAWAEKHYLYEYEYVCDGQGRTSAGAPVSATVANPGQTEVYYAMYESDGDKLKTNITLMKNDGSKGADAVYGTVEQAYGASMQAYGSNPSFENYVFDGFWDQEIGGKQYYKADGTSADGVTWDKVGNTATLYAHWKYKVKFLDNAYDSDGNKVEASIDLTETSIPQTGEGFKVVPEGDGAPFIEAYYGAAVPLPKASREGYKDTRAWGLAAGKDGQANWIVRATSEATGSYSADDKGVKVRLSKAQLLPNGADGAAPDVSAKLNDHGELVLFANWNWQGGEAPSDAPVPSGGKEKYTVRLKAAYTEDGVTYAANWPAGTTLDGGDVVLSDVEYDSVISEKHLTMRAPSFVSATGYGPLVFRGFYTQPNVPTPAEGESYKGARLIKPDAEDETKLVGEGAMRLLPVAQPNGQKEIVLYALWALPNTKVVFHLNKSGLEDVIGYDAVKDKADVLAPAATSGIYTVTIKTNDAIPEIVGDDIENAIDTDAIGNGSYVFNGWWTHPWKEGAGSVQYYGADNQRMTDENDEVLTWKPYVDTVLYAHWTYRIALDANVPADAAGADDVKLQHLAKVGDYTGSAVTGTPDGDTLIDSTSGNVYRYEAAAEGEAARKHLLQADADAVANTVAIDAVLGAPVKLPFARYRTGYDDTVIWNDAAGNAVPVAKDGWTADELGGTKLSKMSFAGTPDATTHAITLTADWSGSHEKEGFGGGALKYTVNLIAAYDGITLTGADETAGTTRIENVEYDAAFSASTETHTVTAPWRNGYTFLGYYAAKPTNENPQGLAWVAAPTDALAQTAALSKQKWDLVPAPGETEIDLYAAWKKDSYLVKYAPTALADTVADALLSPGAQPVQVGSAMPESMTWSYGEKMSSRPAFPKAAAAPTDITSVATPFFRNGYAFDGWYFTSTDADDKKTTSMVSDSLGQGDAAYVWMPGRAWQVANREAGRAVLTLYPAWTAKTYAVVFDTNLPDEDATSTTYPLTAWYGDAAHKNVGKAKDGTVYYLIDFEDDIVPVFDAKGAAVDPSYLDYDFAWWGTDADEPATASNPKNKLAAGATAASYRFAPAFELKPADANNGIVNVITYYGHWTSPEPATVTLYADTPDRTGTGDAPKPRGSFTSDNIDYTGASADESDATHLVLTEVEYGTPLPMSSEDYRPGKLERGYKFAGWARMDGEGRILDASGNTYESAYDAKTGEPIEALLVRDAETRYLKGDNAFVAVYSRAPYTVKLDMSGYDSFELECADGTVWDALQHSFNVEDAPFSLPTNVVVAGKKFAGWKRVSPTEKTWAGTMIVPSTVVAERGAETQVFVPLFDERIYRVDFIARNASSGQGDVRTAYVDFNGKVKGGTLVDAGQASVGQTLSMPSAPAAKPVVIEEESSETISSAIFTWWRMGFTQTGKGVDLKAEATGLTSEQWRGWLTKYATETSETVTFDGVAHPVSTLPVYGIWSTAISATCPLYVTMAVDVETGSVAIPASDFGITASSTETKLSVAALRYDPIVAADDAGKVNAFATSADPVFLNVFAGMSARPDLTKMPDVVNGTLSGDYGKTGVHENPLQIDLRGTTSRTYTAKQLADYTKAEQDAGRPGFTFADTGKLCLWYGLDLDGMRMETLRAIGEKLPRIQDGYAIDTNTWTKDSVPIARLCYTVALAN